MPTYGYECTACEDQFEIFQSIKDDALTTCEKCGGGLRKRIYPVGIAFKGSGFYVNDYSKSAGGSGSKPAETGTVPSTGDAPAKTETPAPKAETAATA
jgi:putative FmdB family regulatory protein